MTSFSPNFRRFKKKVEKPEVCEVFSSPRFAGFCHLYFNIATSLGAFQVSTNVDAIHWHKLEHEPSEYILGWRSSWGARQLMGDEGLYLPKW